MDCNLRVGKGDRTFSWSDSHSLDSDDGQVNQTPGSPSWMDMLPTNLASASGSMPSASSSLLRTHQLSPISNGIDIPRAQADRSTCASTASSASMAPTMINSASSSCTDSWSIDFADSDEVHVEHMDNDIHWEEDSDDILTVPKLEPLEEDDFRMDDLKEAPMAPEPTGDVPALGQPKAKRPRGRPRKHPLTPVVSSSKVTKGRSKTGCITCRKRKKKCDEAKPRCMNCEKNAVVCEGYPEKQIWRSGKERAEEERLKGDTQVLPAITMQPIFNGLENLEDMIFWKHYNDTLSTVLTVEGETKNAFRDMLIPIATKHQGLMHSILALSSKHLDYDTPYGVNLLKKYPSTNIKALDARSDYHHEKAMEKLYEDIAKQQDKNDPNHKLILSARYGQMLCLLLESLAEGSPRGEHRVHLQAYQTLIKHSPPEDPAFFAFITEFFQYHIYADELICYPGMPTCRLAAQDWNPGVPIFPPRLLGVADGLFKCLSQITSIRNAIRANMASHVDPIVDYTHLYKAVDIDNAIKEWVPNWPAGDSRDRVGLLYKQMMWIYLFRTIYPPLPSTNVPGPGPKPLSMLPPVTKPMEAAVGSANTPPHSTPASCASSPSPRANPINLQLNNARRHSIPHPVPNPISRRHSLPDPEPQTARLEACPPATPSSASNPIDRSDSPPPIRLPPGHDNRITLAVEESLAILESFAASDPAQTLLLIPCLVIGTACFSPHQQQRTRNAIRTVHGYKGLRNTDRVMELLEEVWRLMQAGDWARVWDWQGVAKSLGIDFLCS